MGILNNDIKVRAGLYMRVSTEDQAREGFSLPEQKERLEAYCKLNDFEIVDYYEDAGISAKKGNYRPEWERLKEDIKSKKINTMIALKQDRITRSIYDWENILSFLEENEAYLDFVYDDINTTGWHSHIEENDYNDNTVMSSIKLMATEEGSNKIENVLVTVFTYDNDDFDLNGNYRGISKSTLTIKR